MIGLKIVISDGQEIYDLTPEQRSILKDSLTFENPKYRDAKKYSRSGYISIPPYLTYYKEMSVRVKEGVRTKVLRVPLGVNVSKILGVTPISVLDNRVKVDVSYPKFMLDLRSDQQKAVKAYSGRGIIQLPTGKGKTILALYLATYLGQKTLILVHKDDLVTGWKKDIDLCFGGKVDVGLIKAKSRKIGNQLTIATVQTLNRLSEEEMSALTSQFGFVIQDECLVGDTLVCLEDGGVKKIKDICNSDKVIGGSVSNKFNRKSEIYTLSASHAILQGSPTHPTWCVKKGKKSYSLSDFECKSLKDITNDYYIPVKVSIPHTEKYIVPIEEAKFTALIMCDGHIDKAKNSKRVKVNIHKDVEYYNEVMKEYAKFSGAELKQSIDCRGNTTFWFSDSDVKHTLTDKWCVPVGKKSNILFIPDFLYYASLDTIKAFIETCFNCNGDLSISKDNSVRVSFNSASKEFSLGLSLLLRKFGIVSSIQHIKRDSPNHNDLYRLSVSGVFYNKFAEIFTLIDRKSTPIRNTQTQNKRFVGEYYLSPVQSVTKENIIDNVYDFTVSGENHSFIANGVYTHNCHHLGLNIFNIVDRFKSCYKLGLSATPTRSDGLNFVFDLFFGGLCYKHEITEDDEDISQVKVKILDSPFKCKPFVYKGEIFNYYDFKVDELPKGDIDFIEDIPYNKRPRISYADMDNAAVSNDVNMRFICKHIVSEYSKGRSVLVMFTQKEHIDKYFEYLKSLVPEKEIMLYYGDNKEKTEILMQKAENREVNITLATYAKATEGTNVKAWEVLFLVSSLNNAKNVEQALGRIRRRKEGKINPVLVYDINYKDCYSLRNHINTRKTVYWKLKCLGLEKQSLFKRGYKNA